MSPYVAEFVGTMLLILFGNGVVANVLLKRTKGNDAGWIVISAGWGVAVYIGAFCSNEYSGAQLNPAVTVATMLNGDLGYLMGAGYMLAQFLGAMTGALLVYLFYREHFTVTQDPDAKLACFSTAPNIRKSGQAFFCEMIGTFALILPIFLIASPTLVHETKSPVAETVSSDSAASVSDAERTDNESSLPESTLPESTLGLGSLGLLPVGLLVFGIGMSLGGTTGYAINPARDLGPRLIHAFLPIKGKRDSDWSYAWVPVAGPIAGAILATGVFKLLSMTVSS
ncbi:MAG: aquaporin [Rhodopirellula sp.]|jgi:glycerol uptake facilitator protein|nr:aquaporin [Rhodopirellula sp.]